MQQAAGCFGTWPPEGGPLFNRCPVCGLFMDKVKTRREGRPIYKYTCPMHGHFFKEASDESPEWLKDYTVGVDFGFSQPDDNKG